MWKVWRSTSSVDEGVALDHQKAKSSSLFPSVGWLALSVHASKLAGHVLLLPPPLQITVEGRRPVFPPDTPEPFRKLAEWCWAKNPDARYGEQ